MVRLQGGDLVTGRPTHLWTEHHDEKVLARSKADTALSPILWEVEGPHTQPSADELFDEVCPPEIFVSYLKIAETCSLCLMDFESLSDYEEPADATTGSAAARSPISCAASDQSGRSNNGDEQSSSDVEFVEYASPAATDSATCGGLPYVQVETSERERGAEGPVSAEWNNSSDSLLLICGEASESSQTHNATCPTENGAEFIDHLGRKKILDEGKSRLDDEQSDEGFAYPSVTQEDNESTFGNNDDDPTSWIGIISCCRHTFHFDCISRWALRENKCPMCKKRFIALGVYTRKGFRRMARRVVDRNQGCPRRIAFPQLRNRRRRSAPARSSPSGKVCYPDTKPIEARNLCFFCQRADGADGTANELLLCVGKGGECLESAHYACLQYAKTSKYQLFFCPACIDLNECYTSDGEQWFLTDKYLDRWQLPTVMNCPVEAMALDEHHCQQLRSMYRDLLPQAVLEGEDQITSAAGGTKKGKPKISATARAARNRVRAAASASEVPQIATTPTSTTIELVEEVDEEEELRRLRVQMQSVHRETLRRQQQRQTRGATTGRQRPAARRGYRATARAITRTINRALTGGGEDRFEPVMDDDVESIDEAMDEPPPFRGVPENFAEWQAYERLRLGRQNYGKHILSSRREDGGTLSGVEFVSSLLTPPAHMQPQETRAATAYSRTSVSSSSAGGAATTTTMRRASFVVIPATAGRLHDNIGPEAARFRQLQRQVAAEAAATSSTVNRNVVAPGRADVVHNRTESAQRSRATGDVSDHLMMTQQQPPRKRPRAESQTPVTTEIKSQEQLRQAVLQNILPSSWLMAALKEYLKSSIDIVDRCPSGLSESSTSRRTEESCRRLKLEAVVWTAAESLIFHHRRNLLRLIDPFAEQDAYWADNRAALKETLRCKLRQLRDGRLPVLAAATSYRRHRRRLAHLEST